MKLPEYEVNKMPSLRLTATQVCVCLFVVLGVLNVQTAFRAPLSDFGNYYYGSRLWVSGMESTEQLTNVAAFNGYAEASGAQNVFLNYATVSPQTIGFYMPFLLVNPFVAKHVFNWLGILLFVFSLWRFMNRFKTEIGWKQVALLVAALVPLYYNILFGQTYLIITALLLESILHSEKRSWLSGLLLATAIALKISPALLCIWFLAEKKYRVVAWTIVCWLAITGAELLMFPGMWGYTLAFYTEAFPRISNGFISDPYSSSFQGIVVFLRKLMLPDAVLNPDPLINGSERAVHLINLLCYFLIAIVAVGAWKRRVEWRQKMLVLLLVLNITSGYTSTYAMLLLLPFITIEDNVKGWVKVILYGTLFCLPPRIFDGASPFLEEYKLWIFLALFVMECRPAFSYRRLETPQLVVGLFFFAMVLLKLAQRPEQMPLSYYRPAEVKHHYVLSAYPAEGRLQYLSYADGGFHKYSLNIGPEWQPQQRYKENINGVNFYVMAANENELLVLSDYHRGPGLLHLYTIPKPDYEALKRK